MTDEEALKARVDELIENLNYYLRNYNRLIGIGYRKSVLDVEIENLKLEIQRLSARKEFPTRRGGELIFFIILFYLKFM